MEIVLFCIDLSKVLAIILSFSSYLSSLLGVKSLFDIGSIFYTGFYIIFLFAVDMQ